MKLKKLLKKLKLIKELLSKRKNWNLSDLEFEIDYIQEKLSILIKDVDDFGVEEDYNDND